MDRDKILNFICYNALPTICDHAIDFSKEQYKNGWGLERLHDHDVFNPYLVREEDVVFVKTDFIVNGLFVRDYLEKICCRFKLVTGNSSFHIGRDGGDIYKKILNDPRVLKWFCVNPPNEHHDKIVPISIGFEEPSREGGNQETLFNLKKNKIKLKEEKIFLPFHTLETNSQRKKDVELLQNKDFIVLSKNKQSFVDYMNSLNKYKFIIGLEGSGPDIHRAYESLLVGSIPIMKKTALQQVFNYHQLPGIFVNSWEEIDYNLFDIINKKEYNFNVVEEFLSIEYYKKLFRS